MPRYSDRDGDSGIVAFEVGPDWIEIEFERGRERFYRYTNASAGAANILTMQRLAEKGDGLNAFINRYAKNKFASKR